MRSAAASSPTTCRRSAQIVRDAKAKNYRFSAFISGVANSAAFRMGARRAGGNDEREGK